MIRRFVIVTMTDERCRLDPAVCQLTFAHARELAYELLSIAESTEPHADREKQR